MFRRAQPSRLTSIAAVCAVLFPIAAAAQTTYSISAAPKTYTPVFTWSTVANTATVIPNGDGRTFNSFNQPSVNTLGMVVLRGRSKGSDSGGGTGETTALAAAAAATPLHGVYARDMAKGGALTLVFDKVTAVPPPSNIVYSDLPVTFTEFPAFPRIGLASNTMLSRAQSKPVYTYVLPDLTETRVGTSGVYAMQTLTRSSAATQLGAVPGFSHFSVPGALPGTKFDQFPGAPAVADANTVVFKGNYTDGATAKTGIFFRNFQAAKVPAAFQVIASSDTLIPGQPPGGARFGSTAPPSASQADVVFVGLDNEEAPTLGGIYRAPLASRPALQTLVSIGQQVPGETPGSTFTRIGESLSYDGQRVAFWGAWGAEMRSMTLSCPIDGQKDVIAYCNAQYPAGFAAQVPVKQGIFVYDIKTAQIYPVAKTGAEYADFVYWTFSGRPPGVGDSDSEDFEPPRWRTAAFASAYGDRKQTLVAFKARKVGEVAINGIYLSKLTVERINRVMVASSVISPVAESGMRAQAFDPLAPYGAVVTAIGIEREGLRASWLAVAISMLDPITSESWAGVYLTKAPVK